MYCWYSSSLYSRDNSSSSCSVVSICSLSLDMSALRLSSVSLAPALFECALCVREGVSEYGLCLVEIARCDTAGCVFSGPCTVEQLPLLLSAADVPGMAEVLRGDLKGAWTFVEGEPLTLRKGGLNTGVLLAAGALAGVLVVVELGVAGGVLAGPALPCGEDPSSIALIFRAAIRHARAADNRVYGSFRPVIFEKAVHCDVASNVARKTSWKPTLTAGFKGRVSKSRPCGARAGQ